MRAVYVFYCSGGDSDDSNSDRRPGRPPKIVKREDLLRLLQLNLPISDIARQLSLSRRTVYRYIEHYGINYERFSQLSQTDIEGEVQAVKDHPNAGEVMVQGHLASRGLHVQHQKVRQAIHAVDPEGVENRKSKPIRRRVYTSPFPNYVWQPQPCKVADGCPSCNRCVQ